MHERAVRYVTEICNVDSNVAEESIAKAGNVKTACVMLLKNCGKKEAEDMLKNAGGVLRKVI